MDLLVDTSDDPTGKGVREKYVKGIEQLLRKDEKLHAPPIVDFVWGEQVFRGVLQSLEVASCSSTPTASRCARSSPSS